MMGKLPGRVVPVVVAGLLIASASGMVRTRAAAADFPNVSVQTQDGTRVRFYDDLIKGKVVLINFMFTSCTSQCPLTTANLVKVEDALGEPNDVYLSTPHRVLQPSAERYSIAMFVDPNPDALVRAIDSCIAPGESARHEAITAGDYLQQRFAATYRTKSP